jgi:hypothetical protein
LLPPARGAELSETPSYRVAEVALGGVSASIEACLDAVTIADMCLQAESMGILRKSPPAYVYAI